MPIYTFRCSKCKHKFTDIFPMKQSDGKKIVCPKCKTKDVKRVWEGSFFIRRNSCPTCSSGACGLNR